MSGVKVPAYQLSSRLREAAASGALSGCDHRMAKACDTDPRAAAAGYKMCLYCGGFFAYATITNIPLKTTAEQDAKLSVQCDQQRVAYNMGIAHLCDIAGDAAREGRVPSLSLPSKQAMGKVLTGWNAEGGDERLAKGQRRVHMPGLGQAVDAVEKHNLARERAVWRCREAERNPDKEPRRNDAWLASKDPGSPFWPPKPEPEPDPETGEVEEKENPCRRYAKRSLFRTRRATTRRVLQIDDAGVKSNYGYKPVTGMWVIPAVGHVQSRRSLPPGLVTTAFTVLERPGRRLGRRWETNATALIPVPAPVWLTNPLPGPDEAAGFGIGIDLGIVNIIADSQGEMFHYSERIAELEDKAKMLQKLMDRRRVHPPTWGRNEARRRYRAACRELKAAKTEEVRARARRDCGLHELIVFEKLNHRGMRRSAKGTAAKPGKNVAAKRGLNRELGRVAPGAIIEIYRSEAKRTGTRIELVDPRNTSRECAKCGYTDKRNRETQARFVCQHNICRHEDNADTNAAKVIHGRGVAAYIAATLPPPPKGVKPGPGCGDIPDRANQTCLYNASTVKPKTTTIPSDG